MQPAAAMQGVPLQRVAVLVTSKARLARNVALYIHVLHVTAPSSHDAQTSWGSAISQSLPYKSTYTHHLT